MPKARKEPPWGKSLAKALLHEDLRNGVIPLNSKVLSVKEIVVMRPEFGGVDDANIKKFSSRLRSARKFITDSKARAESDRIGIEHDLAIINATKSVSSEGEVKWYGSLAEHSLKQDFDEKRHETMNAKELYESRYEYQNFSYATFRAKIRQEEKSRKFKAQFGLLKKALR